MEVILREDVEGVGRTGDVVNVKRGFARNYLLSQNLAIEATRRNLKQLEHQKRLLAKQADRQRREAMSLVEGLDGLSITVAKASGDGDKLYGSVTARDIVAALFDEGIQSVSRKQIMFSEPIRQLGIYDLPIRLSAGQTVMVKLWVVSK